MTHGISQYLEPVYGAAVDEGGEHAEAVAESISNGAHGEDHMEVLLDPLNEEVVHREGSGINLPSLQEEIDQSAQDCSWECTSHNVMMNCDWADLCSSHHLHLFNDFSLLIWRVEVRDIPRVQDHVQIFHK